jgi:hypothetical protein
MHNRIPGVMRFDEKNFDDLLAPLESPIAENKSVPTQIELAAVLRTTAGFPNEIQLTIPQRLQRKIKKLRGLPH